MYCSSTGSSPQSLYCTFSRTTGFKLRVQLSFVDCNLSLGMLNVYSAVLRAIGLTDTAIQMSNDSQAAASVVMSPFLSIESIISELL